MDESQQAPEESLEEFLDRVVPKKGPTAEEAGNLEVGRGD